MGFRALNKVFIVVAILFIGLILVRGGISDVFAKNDISKQEVSKDIKVMLYSKKGCRYCRLAKELLEARGVQYEVIELTNNRDLIKKLIRQTGQNTVPYVFVNGEFIGGYSNLCKLDKQGKL